MNNLEKLPKFNSDFNTISNDFIKQGIQIDKPAFYDSKPFLKVENQNEFYRYNYARFVQTRPYSNEYLIKARNEIRFISELLNQELIKDGQKGACIDTSLILSRMLEKEGFWNFPVSGKLTIKFPKCSKTPYLYFEPTNNIPDCSHTWLFAPPFKVLDITIKQQKYTKDIESFIPNTIFSETMNNCQIEPRDIYIKDLNKHKNKGKSNAKLMKPFNNHYGEFINTFKPYIINYQKTIFKYIALNITLPGSTLEEVNDLNSNDIFRINDNNGLQIYNNIILPQLKEYREKEQHC